MSSVIRRPRCRPKMTIISLVKAAKRRSRSTFTGRR